MNIRTVLNRLEMQHILLFVSLIYIPILLLLSESFGLMMFRTGDEAGYFDTVKRIQDGMVSGNISHAFSGSTYSYGFGYFIVLAIVSFPFYFFNFEQGIILNFESIAL
ncbi:hypothetical protein Theco_3909 [Thermobacillus composti KWC4]|uniref:Uncharacterized protein n=1 Tax=Thermobacillus composti (strain DSM 18247 / JCM 13945 / KWC4) TaxID=717605 RepID=L0EI40_THECK|nr:hypothetical protein [Thermobacillus composti]AGA59918.1 hypothetical protein Theco_3909 [Thermobacillus composti KWC4]